jgi:hypothetical protein
MGGWLIEQTDLYAIKYDLLREARVGDTVLGVLGIDQTTNGFTSLIPGGLVTGWLPDVMPGGNVGSMVRKFSLLMLDPVTVQICKKAAAFQMGTYVYKKKSESPYDGVSTPAKWVFNVEYLGTNSAISL